MPDIGILSNDLSVNKQFKLGDSTMDVRGGLFFSRQNVAVRWAISERLIGDAPNGALIDVFNGAGTALTAGGLTGYNNQWGGCCARDTNVDFTTTAPYLGVNYATGGWDFDGGLRQEYFSANGTYSGSMAVAPNVFVTDTAHPGLANYSVNYLSYSAGANYRISNDLSVFGRLSKGHRAMSDRLLYSPNIDAATGLLTSGGKSAAVAPVEQAEVGVRYRFKSGSTRFGVAATVFDAKTTEYDYDPTRDDNPASPNYKGPKLNVQGFKSQGLELETSAAVGSFGINFNATYTDEKVASDLVDKFKIGKTTAGVPKWRYTISPRFALGQAVIGATVRGQSEVYFNGDNTIKVGGYFVTSAFANYDFGNGLVGSLNVGNLFNVLHPTGGGDGFQAGIFKGNTETGRSINASIRYSF
jgi:outer membrane receptor protein involved in Fe transport